MTKLRDLKNDPYRSPKSEVPLTPSTYLEAGRLPCWWRDSEAGSVTIMCVLKPGVGKRLNFEQSDRYSGPEMGIAGYEDYDRGHSQGQGTGHESDQGIVYMPREVNRQLLNNGVEATIRNLEKRIKEKGISGEFRLITITATHWGTLRLAGIKHFVVRWEKNQHEIVYQSEITVSNDVKNPRISHPIETEPKY